MRRIVLAGLLMAGCTTKEETTTRPERPPTGGSTTVPPTGTGTGTGSTPTATFDGQLVGLSVELATNFVEVGRFDTANGTFTSLGSPPFDSSVINSQESVLLPDRNLYVVLDRGRVVSFDVATGAVVHDFDLGTSFRGVEYDAVTGLLVGIWAPLAQDVTYATLDLDTQAVTLVTPFPSAPSMNAQANAIDPDGRRYYFSVYYSVDDDRLVTLDLDSGAVLSEIPVGNPYYGGMSWDPLEERLLAFYIDWNSEGFAAIDPATADVTFIGTEVTNGNSGAFDPDTRRFYMDCGPSLAHAICWYDADTGALIDRLDTQGMEYGYHPL